MFYVFNLASQNKIFEEPGQRNMKVYIAKLIFNKKDLGQNMEQIGKSGWPAKSQHWDQSGCTGLPTTGLF